jgi:hypothetical protein
MFPEEGWEGPAAPVPAPASARAAKKMTKQDGADAEGDNGDHEETVELDSRRHSISHEPRRRVPNSCQ